MKDALNARTMPLKAGSSSTIRRCWDGQTMSQTKGQRIRAANKIPSDLGRRRRAGTRDIKTRPEDAIRADAEHTAEYRGIKRLQPVHATPQLRTVVKTMPGLAP